MYTYICVCMYICICIYKYSMVKAITMKWYKGFPLGETFQTHKTRTLFRNFFTLLHICTNVHMVKFYIMYSISSTYTLIHHILCVYCIVLGYSYLHLNTYILELLQPNVPIKFCLRYLLIMCLMCFWTKIKSEHAH